MNNTHKLAHRYWRSREAPEDASLCLFSHLGPTVTYQLPFLLIFATGVTFPAPVAETRTPIHTRSKRAASRRNLLFLLPSESPVVSPPLYSWGAPTETPPTFCHVGNKSAPFILIFSRLSAAPLFGYLVWPLSRNGGVWMKLAV